MYQERDITVSLNELLKYNFEKSIDLFETLFFADDSEEDRGILSDISYEPIAVRDGMVVIRISATVEHFDDYAEEDQ